MQVNATTLVQICNFWITYFFLQKIFFKPAITRLLQKEALKKALRDDLKYKETAILQLQEKKNRHVIDFKKLVEKNYRFSPHSVPDIPSGVTYLPTEEEICKLHDTIAETLTKKVPHAF